MKILKRQVVVSKSAEEIMQILKSCAYRYSKSTFEETEFSMCCPQRYNGGIPALTRIKGHLTENGGNTTVILEVHADFLFYFGLLFVFSGLLKLIYSLATCTGSWIFCLVAILLGLVFSSVPAWAGVEHLDIIEHKLTRQ